MHRFILPVKGLGRGKTRVRGLQEDRAELVDAMLLDTLQAALSTDLGTRCGRHLRPKDSLAVQAPRGARAGPRRSTQRSLGSGRWWHTRSHPPARRTRGEDFGTHRGSRVRRRGLRRRLVGDGHDHALRTSAAAEFRTRVGGTSPERRLPSDGVGRPRTTCRCGHVVRSATHLRSRGGASHPTAGGRLDAGLTSMRAGP